MASGAARVFSGIEGFGPGQRVTTQRRLELGGGLTAEVLRGEREIADAVRWIDGFVEASGGAGVLGGTSVWMRDAAALDTVPIAVLLYRDERVEAVALASEIKIFGRRSRLAMCGNLTGQRGVFAPEEMSHGDREQMARAAVDAMLGCGMFLVLCSLKRLQGANEERPASPYVTRWSADVARAQREVYDTFDLAAGSFHRSLGRLGAHTRRNLRYYRRRVERELQCSFTPCMEGQTLREAVLELQFHTDDPVKAGIAKNRIAQVSRGAGAFCMGLRASDGRWLSWVSGWRDGSTTYIDWQCNRREMPRYSLSTAMRSYLIEHECELGQSAMRFLGGTPHTMHYGFREEVCTDRLMVRRGAWRWLLRKMAAPLRVMRNMLRPPSTPGAQERRRSAARQTPVMQLLKRMAGVLMSDGKA